MTSKNPKPVYRYVYMIYDHLTADFYIGKRTSKLPPNDDPYMGSGRWVQKHEVEFGKYLRNAPAGRFKKRILRLCTDAKSLMQHESDAIKVHSYNSNSCQNIQNSFKPPKLTPKQLRKEHWNKANATYDITSIRTGVEYCAKRKDLSSTYGISPPEVAPFLAGRIDVANGFCLSKNADRLRKVSVEKSALRPTPTKADLRGAVISSCAPKVPEPFIIRHKTMAEKLAGFR